jgi:hypothetical protein
MASEIMDSDQDVVPHHAKDDDTGSKDGAELASEDAVTELLSKDGNQANIIGEIDEVATEKDNASAITNDGLDEGGAIESQMEDTESAANAMESEEQPPIEWKPLEDTGTVPEDELEKSTEVGDVSGDYKEQSMTDNHPSAAPVKDVYTEKGDHVHEVQTPSITQAGGFVQILSLLWKNMLTKIRTPVATFFELFSPLLMMLILSAAYQLSEIAYEDAATYASISVDLPGPWLDLLSAGTFFNLTQSIPGSSRRYLMEFDPKDAVNGEMVNGPAGKLFPWLDAGASHGLIDELKDHASSIRRLQTETENENDETERDNASDAYNFLDDARQQVRTMTCVYCSILLLVFKTVD